MTIKVWCRVRSGVDHEVVEVKCADHLTDFVDQVIADHGLYSGDRFIPWHQITYIEAI